MDLNNLRIGLLLGFWQLKRANAWTTFLIVFVMTLTFLNLVVVSGILIGLVQGSSDSYQRQYSGDILVDKNPFTKYISKGNDILSAAKDSKEIEAASARYLEGAVVQSDFTKNIKANEVTPQAAATIAGIEPVDEDRVTGLSKLVVAGKYFDRSEFNSAVIGSGLLAEYNPNAILGETLKNVVPGSKVRISVNGGYIDLKIKGIVKSKVGDVNRRIYIDRDYFTQLYGRSINNPNEIAIKISPGVRPESVKLLLQAAAQENALVQTARESQGSFLKDIEATFSLLGGVIGGIAIMVSSITIFIVIFINALTRKKYIGILKAIGIKNSVIAASYLAQALFYSVAGISVGLMLLYGSIKPYFDANPINFPFSDGILAVTATGVAWRVIILVGATVAAGILPILFIVRKNTLNLILGRE
ncbi:MAG: FtsX-like permease family protein [Candidatus Pacebacteria bacterium]|jgi:putative ABC transport system permease protein|nr:FtsX-like permease family protein [Candidatus Paceibacterota bacterium]